MATKKLTDMQAAKAALKSARHDLARLKKLGLYKGNARKTPTKYAKGLLKKFSDVLTGKAKVITTPSQSAAREHKEIYRTKFRKVIVPVRPGEKLYYNKTKGFIFSYNTEYGHKVKRIFPKHALTEAEADRLSQNPNIRYAIPIGTGQGVRRMRFETYGELKAYMQSDSLKGYNKWNNHVEIEEIIPGDDENYGENEDEDF
jgi:hypothetical protein